MHTLVSKLVALNVENYYMALTEIQLKICKKYVGFVAPLAKKVPDPWTRHSRSLMLLRL